MTTTSEEKLIALCASNVDLLRSSLKDIDPQNFEKKYNKKIYKTLESYYLKYGNIPNLDILEERLYENKSKIFENDPNADQIILNLRTQVAVTSQDDYPFLVENVRESAAINQFREKIPKAVELIKQHQDPQQAADLLLQTATSMKQKFEKQASKQTSTHDYVDKMRERYFAAKENPEVAWGLKTGFKLLDDATYGVDKGELLIIAGRHGSGKSMWLLNAAVNMYKAGHNVALISLEMPTDQYWDRFIACYCDLPSEGIKSGTLNPMQQEKYMKALDEFEAQQNRFTLVDIPHATVPTITAEIGTIAKKYQPEVLVIDYLGILRSTDPKLKDHEAQAMIVEEVRKLGRTMEIPILTAAQLNRDSGSKGKKAKGTERLSRSDNIGATADIVLAIEEIDPEEALTRMSDKTKIFVVKNRKGKAPFEFETRVNFACSKFEDWNMEEWLDVETSNSD